jgi:hypothetical protein
MGVYVHIVMQRLPSDIVRNVIGYL